MSESVQSAESSDPKAKQYARIKRRLFVLDVFLTAAFLILFQISGWSKYFENLIYSCYPNFYIKNMLYVVGFIVFSTILFFPVHYYGHFRLEHRFGLSNMSFGHWLLDGFKSFVLNVVIAVVAAEVIYSFLRAFPMTWWLWSAFFYFFFTIFLARVTPTLILPLFFKLRPLADENLKERLKALAQKVGARILGIYEMDMSRKTKKANAMFTGLGRSKRIILGDTLISRYDADEIEVILAHELGHFYYRHLWRFIILGLGTSLAGFYCVHWAMGHWVAMLGIGEIHNIAGLPAFLLILFLFFILLMPLQNGYSRRLERQADRFALETTGRTEAFVRSMKKLAQQNLSEASPPRWVEFLLHDHPSIEKRIKFAEGFQKQP